MQQDHASLKYAWVYDLIQEGFESNTGQTIIVIPGLLLLLF